MDIDWTIAKAKENLSSLTKELEIGKTIDQEFLSAYEYEILDFTIALSELQYIADKAMLDMKKMMDERHESYKNRIVIAWEKYTSAEWTRATEYFLKDSLHPINEAILGIKNNERILNAYKRHADSMKSKLIWAMADAKRQDYTIKTNSLYYRHIYYYTYTQWQTHSQNRHDLHQIMLHQPQTKAVTSNLQKKKQKSEY